jgi:hypothetical protein
MTIVMNMSGYEIEREMVALDEYSDEVMWAELIPQLVPASDSHVVEMDKRPAFSPELAEVDIAAFLQKMYKYQR